MIKRTRVLKKGFKITGSVIILSLLICRHITFAETIILKTGKKIEGEIVESNSDYVKVDISGVSVPFFLDEIESIDGEGVLKTAKTAKNSLVLSEEISSEIFSKYSSSVVQIQIKLFGKYYGGVGFIISSDGLIMTNFHVVGGAEEILVKLEDGRVFTPNYIVGYDHIRDICVFKIDASDLRPVVLGNSDSLKEGERLFTLSISSGEEYYLLEGGYLGRKILYGNEFLQTNISGSSGNSGSPVFDSQGDVIGMFAFGDERMRNWRFAIPINEAKEFISANNRISIREFERRANKAYVFGMLGKNSATDGEWNSAVTFHEKAIEIEPNYAEAHAHLGTAYLKTGKTNQAIAEYKKALALERDYAEIYANLAFCYIVADMMNQAYDAAQTAVNIDPDYLIAHYALGFVCVQSDALLDQATDELETAIAIDPTYCPVYESIIRAYSKKREYETAKKYYNEAINLECSVSPEVVAELN